MRLYVLHLVCQPAVNFINIYEGIFRTKCWYQSQNVTRKAAKKDVCTQKACEKTLMKFTPERERERESRNFFAPLLLSKEGHVLLVLLQGILSLSLSLSYLMLLFVG